MANPVFRSNGVFGESRAAGRAVTHTPELDARRLEEMYEAPAATTRETGRLTYDDVIMKTGGLLAVVVVVGALTWTLFPGLWIVGMLVGLVLGLVNAFKREPSPALITAYAVAQGVFLGGVSAFFEARWPGIAVQAVLATVATFTATLLLFRSGKVRVTPKFTRWLMIALVGYALFCLVNLGLVWFGGMDGFGLRSMEISIPIIGTVPLGLLIGIVAVGLAAMALIMDFDAIQNGVRAGAPAKFAWSAAFGLLVTLIWLYVEFLRLLAILRGSD